MKTKPITVRFDADDLILAQNLSGIYKPQELVDTLLSEYVKPLKGKKIELPKDFMEVKRVATINEKGEIKPLIFTNGTPKTLDELKALCPFPKGTDEFREWVRTERQKYNI